jgi:hypothetical protein
MLKSLKKQEIVDKLKKAEFLAGQDLDLNRLEKELNTDFIPDLYDKSMTQAFDEKYYDNSDSETSQLEDKKVNLNLLKDQAMAIQGGKQKEEAEDGEIELGDLDYEEEINKAKKGKKKSKQPEMEIELEEDLEEFD